MVTISPTLQTKIERRARRAFGRHDESDSYRSHRITSITKDALKYRIPRSGRKTVDVIRKDDGTIVVDPPTTGLIDVLTRDDIKRLKNHEGEVRAYMLVKAGTTYAPTTYVQKSEPLKSRAQCVDQIKVGDHVYVVEVDYDDLYLASSDTGDFTAREFEITGELDPEKDLGFTTGLFDLQTKVDVESLRKKKHLGRVRAYKYTNKDAESPVQSPKLKYVPGKDYEIRDANTNPDEGNCHKGINVADIEWVKGYTKSGDNRIFAFEFEMDDIAAIPTRTDGKFRVHRCKCVEELDPKTLKPIKPAPRSPQDDLEDLTAPEETIEKPKKPKKEKKERKKRGILDKLLGRGKED